MMEITPYKNGIHSLAEGLKNLNSFLHEGGDAYKMKEVIIKIHHGLETLFKDILFRNNPIFILDDKANVKQIIECYKGFHEGQNSYLFDEEKTITPTEAIKRIKTLHLCGEILPKEFANITDSFDSLNALRNQLQHFALTANPDAIIRILGNLVPRSIALLKTCYAKDSNESYRSRLNIVSHKPLNGMAQLFGNQANVDEDLDNIYPNATEVIKVLEAKFDILLNEAIKNFKKKVFLKQKQNISISDHGRVGAPPYFPRINLEGWMNEKLEPHRNSSPEYFRMFDEQISATYSATLKIEQPVVKIAATDAFFGETVSDLRINCDFKILVLNPESFFSIEGTKEFINFIKSPQISIKFNILCEVKGSFDDHHFDIRSLNSLSGNIVVEMSSLVYGDLVDKPSIFGTQSASLNMSNTSIRMHAFVGGNKKLRENYSLDLDIDFIEDILFK